MAAPAKAPGAQVRVKHALQGLMVQYESQFATWVELPFPAEWSFGQYTSMMAKNLRTIGMQNDSNLHMFIKPGGSSAGFTPTPDQSLGDLYDLFKTAEGYLIVDIAAQPMYG